MGGCLWLLTEWCPRTIRIHFGMCMAGEAGRKVGRFGFICPPLTYPHHKGKRAREQAFPLAGGDWSPCLLSMAAFPFCSPLSQKVLSALLCFFSVPCPHSRTLFRSGVSCPYWTVFGAWLWGWGSLLLPYFYSESGFSVSSRIFQMVSPEYIWSCVFGLLLFIWSHLFSIFWKYVKISGMLVATFLFFNAMRELAYMKKKKTFLPFPGCWVAEKESRYAQFASWIQPIHCWFYLNFYTLGFKTQWGLFRWSKTPLESNDNVFLFPVFAVLIWSSLLVAVAGTSVPIFQNRSDTASWHLPFLFNFDENAPSVLPQAIVLFCFVVIKLFILIPV